MPVTRLQKWLTALGIALLLIPCLFWALVMLYVPGLIQDEVSAFGEKIGYRIEVDDVELSPWQLRVRMSGIRLTPGTGDALLTLNQLEVDARWLPLLTGRVSLERIGLDSPKVLLARGVDVTGRTGEWNWLRLANQINQLVAKDPAADPEQHSTLKISLDEFSLRTGRLIIQEGAGRAKSTYDLGPFNLQLTDLSNEDESGHVGGASLQSKYTFHLGGLKIPLPKQADVPPRELSFSKVTASGQLVSDAESTLSAVLDLTLDGGTIKSIWAVTANDGITGKISVADLQIKPWLSLAPSFQRLDSNSGVINGNFQVTQAAEALTVWGDVKFDQVDIRVQDSKQPLLAWNATSLSRFQLVIPRRGNKPAALTMDELVVDQPKIRFMIDAQRQSNFRSLFSKPVPLSAPLPGQDAEPEAGTANTASVNSRVAVGAPPEPGFRYEIRSVRLKNGHMFFGDESIKPQFMVDVSDLNGSIQGISNAPGRYATLALNGRAAKSGSLRARGQLAFADPRLNHDVLLVFKNIPLTTTSPYAMTFAGYRLDGGRIDVDLRYVTKEGQLQGKNRFVIKKIKLGEAVADYQGTRLPLGLAIALLEDANGLIDVNIPVRGNVNEPEFSVGHLVWQAVKTVLSNIATAPFRALGALMGLDNMDAIRFVPGESALPPDGDEQLSKIAEYLSKHPKSKLVIHGTYDPDIDAHELARAMADRAVLEASGLTASDGEPLPTPNFSDPRVKAALKSVYGNQVGRIKLGQRLLTLPDNAERDQQLRQELIESYKVTDAQLKQLGMQRAEILKRKLLAGDEKLGERVSIGDPETVTGSEMGVPVNVTLESG